MDDFGRNALSHLRSLFMIGVVVAIACYFSALLSSGAGDPLNGRSHAYVFIAVLVLPLLVLTVFVFASPFVRETQTYIPAGAFLIFCLAGLVPVTYVCNQSRWDCFLVIGSLAGTLVACLYFEPLQRWLIQCLAAVMAYHIFLQDVPEAYSPYVWLAAASFMLAVSTTIYNEAGRQSGVLVFPDQSPASFPEESHQEATRQEATRESATAGTDGGATAPASLSYPATKARYHFADVVGMDALKLRLREAVSEILSARKDRRPPRNGFLLSGEPGNGKTFIAEAIAGEMNLPFVSVSFGNFASQWVNQTSQQVRQAFTEAKRQAPCVLFLDEIDSLLKERSKVVNSDSEVARTTNILLTELVDIRASEVIVIAATNFIEQLDPAAVRDGRFDFKIEIPNPDAPARRGVIEQTVQTCGRYAHGKCLQIERSALDQAVKRWEGFSVARIRAAIDETCRLVIKDQRLCITYPDLQVALRTVQGAQGTLQEGTPELVELSLSPLQHDRLVSISQRMRHIEAIEDQGGTVPTGMLFFGPPGTGKTLAARALAKTSGWAFLSTTGVDLVSDTGLIESLLRRARDLRPCMIFIDEADDVCSDRQMVNPAIVSVTNKLLTAMDGAQGKSSDILWIAATNHPENLDPAILRRLVEKIEFALPDAKTLALFIDKWLEKKPTVALAKNLSPASLGVRLQGCAIAHVQEVLQAAVNHAISTQVLPHLAKGNGARRLTVVHSEDIEQARQTVLGC
jgi:transitional endoplasmic reticulum ATPase